jgi:hypothetical protein
MASQNQNNNHNNVSDVITQAHDCLHGSYTEPSTSANVSQPNVNNQTFNYSSNFTQAPPPNLPRPILQSTPPTRFNPRHTSTAWSYLIYATHYDKWTK